YLLSLLFLFVLLRPSPISPLFPYTTLFRSLFHARRQVGGLPHCRVVHVQVVADGPHHHLARVQADPDLDLDSVPAADVHSVAAEDRKSTRLNSSHDQISYAVFCLKKKKKKH